MKSLLDRIKPNKQEQAESKKKSEKYDQSFLAAIQPVGGVSFKDKYIKKGDGYEACIHIWDYPSSVDELWLEKLSSMRDVIFVKDIATMEKDQTISSINKSMVEQDTRYRSSKHQSERMDASQSYSELEDLYKSISQMGEVVKLIHIRLFVHEKTIMQLEQKVQSIITDLTSYGFKGQIFLNESRWEWQSLFLPYKDQQLFPNKREGKGLPALSLAAGLPFHFSELNDPKGSYLGLSFTGGNVIFDMFHKDKKRRYYNGVVVGTMGAGKSTALKKLTTDNACRGYFIRGFDVTGEFATLVDALNGQSLSLDGSHGIINPLQIYRVADNGEDTVKDENLSFMQHLSKVATFYEFVANDPSTDELEEFKKILRAFYESLGFIEKIHTTGVTDLPNEEYPIFSDLLHFIRKELYEHPEQRIIRPELSIARANRLEKIELVLDNLVHSYAHLFNGHTTLPDFTNEQVIFFSIRNLTRLEKNIFNAQMYNALTMIWDNLIQIGAPQMKALYKDGFDVDEAIRFLVIIDESHRMINSENMLAVSFLTDFAREARKYFGGLLLASQSIRDFVPDHSDTEVVTKIRTLFELTQYKFIMQQDSNTLDSLRAIFEGQMSESELAQIPQFQQGDCLLSINGVGNLMFTVEASEEELALFTGGM
ncbi:type IV secretion system protein VirB4 [Bacillus badius]|uniref:VirB4 family type IV secretion system protein n=1 Tax=Bacillus badius TaxID=1455 RepID=UPI001CBFC9F9|nr:type IV secretion system protein VirB4 [Bacillus badius]MED0668066.1 type IV secretion system protein VirB4 [Bacillus badius]UAT32951.1 type IV secretion system protein VirB4 [Bacillus badius]